MLQKAAKPSTRCPRCGEVFTSSDRVQHHMKAEHAIMTGSDIRTDADIRCSHEIRTAHAIRHRPVPSL